MLIFGFVSDSIDHGAHLGGLLAGLSLGLTIFFHRMWLRVIGLVAYFIIVVIPFLMLFLVVDVPQDAY